MKDQNFTWAFNGAELDTDILVILKDFLKATARTAVLAKNTRNDLEGFIVFRNETSYRLLRHVLKANWYVPFNHKDTIEKLGVVIYECNI